MNRTTLSLDYTPVLEMGVVGISTPEKPHRITSGLNNQLDWQLKREKSLELPHPRNSVTIPFPYFKYEDPLNRTTYHLVANRSEGVYLLEERQEADYLLLIKGNRAKTLQKELKSNINKLSIVLTAFPIDTHQLNSKENLLLI